MRRKREVCSVDVNTNKENCFIAISHADAKIFVVL